MEDKYGFVYKWTDNAQSKIERDHKIIRYYIGAHWVEKMMDIFAVQNGWATPIEEDHKILVEKYYLKVFTNKEDLWEEEIKWLKTIPKEELGKGYYNLRNEKYNIKDMSGEKNPMYGISLIPWNKGKNGYKTKPCSEERKRKIGLANSNKKLSEEQKEKLRLTHLGKTSPNKGKTFSEEHKKKLKDNHWSKKDGYVNPKGMLGKSSPMKGIPLSEEHKQKVSEANRGKHYSPSTEFKSQNLTPEEKHRRKLVAAKKYRDKNKYLNQFSRGTE